MALAGSSGVNSSSERRQRRWKPNSSMSPKDRYAPTPENTELFALVDAHRGSSSPLGSNNPRFEPGICSADF